MVVTDNERYAQRLKSLRNQGRSPAGDGSFVELGYNYRMSELTAQLGRCQLEQLPSFISSRQKVEERYVSLLSHLEEMRVPPIPKDRSPFVFIVQFKSKELREKVRADLTERGVQTALYFQPIHLEPFYRGRFHYRPGQFPNAEFAGDTCLALPFYNQLDEVDQKYVAECIEDSLVKHRKKSSISV